MVRGDLVVFGGNAIVEGRVTGNVFVIGGNIRAEIIRGDLLAKTEIFIAGSTADLVLGVRSRTGRGCAG